MRHISNSDYHQALRLLWHLASMKGNTLKESEASRKAALLAKKWERKDACGG